MQIQVAANLKEGDHTIHKQKIFEAHPKGLNDEQNVLLAFFSSLEILEETLWKSLDNCRNSFRNNFGSIAISLEADIKKSKPFFLGLLKVSENQSI